jgi:hypothetical protein
MKKTTRKPLTFRSETIKALTEEQLYTSRGAGLAQDKCTGGISGCSTVWTVKCSNPK